METLNDKIAAFLAYGNDSCSGDGSGYGSGNDGYGYGSGNDGYGYGSGSGSGNGDGDGYGSGIKSFKGYTVYSVDGTPTLIYAVKGNLAVGATINRDLTLNKGYIAKRNGFFAHGSTARDAVNAATMKALKSEPTENRVKRFAAAYPKPDVKIPAQELFEWHHILTGSCEFGRRQFAKNHEIDLAADSFTVVEFVELTKDDYGGEAIKLISKYYSKWKN